MIVSKAPSVVLRHRKARKAEIPSAQDCQESKTAQAQSAAAASDSVQLKSAEIAATAKEMASAAPVDMENVNRIKSAIKEGSTQSILTRSLMR